MPRAPRIQEAGYVHHVVCRGNDRQPLFNSKKDFQTYLEFLEEARKQYPLNVYNFCLMDNHLHLLVEPKEEGAMSKVMEMVSKAYAKYFNKTYNRVGHLFQGRFKSFLIQSERYFFACSRYIDLNPVKANIADDPKNYTWSGHSWLAYGKEPSIKVDMHELYNGLGHNSAERQVAYRALVANYHGDELDLLDRRAGVLGDEDFKDKVKKLV